MEKGPGIIFRDESSVTDTKLEYDMVNYDNNTIKNLHMCALGSLINTITEVKNINAKRSPTRKKVIQQIPVADVTCSTKFTLRNEFIAKCVTGGMYEFRNVRVNLSNFS